MKVCILAAGTGSRNTYSKILPKGFLPINNQPGITHLIDSLHEVEEIVIAIGSRGSIYKEFLPLLYPKIKITFVDIENYDGPGSGPGMSLLQCSKHLDDQFILLPTDAYVDEKINSSWDGNWMGVSKVTSTKLYCLLQADPDNKVLDIYDKNPDAPIECLENGFNGIAFIKDVDIFFDSLEKDKSLIGGEIQVSNGFRKLLSTNSGPGLSIKRIDTWHDFGSNEQYLGLINKFENQNLIKNDEFTYIYKDVVYKYHEDMEKNKNKIKRGELLKDFTPQILNHTDHFYTYQYVKGELLSQLYDENIFKNFFKICEDQIFINIDLNEKDKKQFKNNCLYFYKDKTVKRLEMLFEKEKFTNVSYKINGIECSPVYELLNNIDWNNLSEGIPYKFHGDLQPENIINVDEGFKFIDWRENFGESDIIGDLYYDLAKLNHGLILSGDVVRSKGFSVNFKDNEYQIDFLIKSNLFELKYMLEDFANKHSYDLNKINILTSLIYLNISPLYEGEYSKFLFLLGLLKLQQLS